LRALAQLRPPTEEKLPHGVALLLVVYRGDCLSRYLQRNSSVGRAAASQQRVRFRLVSALLMRSGVRGMVLLTVSASLQFVGALSTQSACGIFAHAWHDLIAGLALALLKSNSDLIRNEQSSLALQKLLTIFHCMSFFS